MRSALRGAARASLSFSSGGMRRSTTPLSLGAAARAAARLERDGEPGGEDADGDVVEAARCADATSSDEARA